MCVDAYGSLYAGADLGIWYCHSGSNQKFRAGYNNFGTTMGMRMWAINQSYNIWCGGSTDCSNSYNPVGHAFVELWNTYGVGTHNTFSRWNFDDGITTSAHNASNDCTNNNNSVNNICDKDAIIVDNEIDLASNPSKYANFRKRSINLNKEIWDYIVFGSGFRNNYYNNQQVDIGGSGTYNWYTSFSRSESYPATYGSNQFPPDMRYVCSGYSIKLWNAYKGNNAGFNSSSIWSPYPFIPAVIYDQM
jgi:hypothetical protein